MSAQEPDSKDDIELVVDGHRVMVPQGLPKKEPLFSCSSFSNSEYLVYKESQQCIRYMITIRMP